jgi:HSP20 family protein
MGIMKSPKQPKGGALTPYPVLDEMDRMSGVCWGPGHGSDEGKWNWAFAVDFAETKDAFTFKAELPGLNSEDVKIICEGNILTITAEKKMEKTSDEKTMHSVERVFGSFLRSFTLPSGVKPEDIKAVCKEGVLMVTVPKGKGEPAKKVHVKVE